MHLSIMITWVVGPPGMNDYDDFWLNVSNFAMWIDLSRR